VGKYTILRLHVFNKTFLPKIIKIQQRLLELQRKMLGVFLLRQCTYSAPVSRRCKALQRVNVRHRANANVEAKADLDLDL